MMKFFYCFFTIALMAIGLNRLTAQVDNPLLDQVLVQHGDYIPDMTPRPMTVITDNSGYDNFDLGADFAEVHIVTNPGNPLQFIASWNLTNGCKSPLHFRRLGMGNITAALLGCSNERRSYSCL